ncbi:MAG: type I glyceraldehyde-3-phosphate dehydrogenase [Candidatus Zambryskibacteria bacterium]|nr:type I glyceraldehyde-3-phosphate dehydrogenase [Candidatus Zambryskibacteria bacterium]
MKKIRVAINGFGRIGRAFYKLAVEKPELEVIAVNDLSEKENLEYLLRHDSVYGAWEGKLDIKFLSEKEPSKLPWKDLDIDVVVESSGAYESYEKARAHIMTGAKRVVITAPAKDDEREDAKTVLMGVNKNELGKCIITSNGSCTTNSASPVMEILNEKLGIKKAFLNTVHGYTATQSLVDGPTKGPDLRRGRAAAINIVPSTTGAAISVGRAVHELLGKFDGVAMRVPVSAGSLSAIVFLSEKQTTPEEINSILEEAAKEPRWQGIFTITREQVVSTDIIGNKHAAIADLSLTHVTAGDLCAVYSWYDNEMGYTNTLVQHVIKLGDTI